MSIPDLERCDALMEAKIDDIRLRLKLAGVNIRMLSDAQMIEAITCAYRQAGRGGSPFVFVSAFLSMVNRMRRGDDFND